MELLNRTLVLVDADHVELGRESAIRGTRSHVVIVVGMSSAEASYHRYTFAHVFAGARDMVPDAEDVQVELALTLAMPEACDGALLSLAEVGASWDTSGDFEELVLLTRDDGLTRALHTKLPPRWSILRRYGVLRAFARPTAARWARASSLPASPRPPIVRDGSSPTWIIDSAASAVQARSLHVQLRGELFEVAEAIERRPALLTQVGLTTTSARGVRRLVLLPNGKGALMPCSEHDGLELENPSPWPPNIPGRVSVADHPVGAGALRIEWGDPRSTLSVRTRLPSWLVARVLDVGSVPFGTDPNRLDDDAILARHHALVGRAVFPRVGAGHMSVAFSVPKDTTLLRAEITNDPRALPSWWWRCPFAPTAPQAKAKIDHGAELLPQAFEGVVAVPSSVGGRLLLESPVAPGTTALPARDLAANTLGPAETPAGRVALLAVGRQRPQGVPLEVVPIREVDPKVIFATSGRTINLRLINQLRLLPIVVPVPARLSDPDAAIVAVEVGDP